MADIFRKATPNDLSKLISFYGEISDAMIGTPFDCRWRRGDHPDGKMLADAIGEGALTIAEDGGAIAAAVIANHDLDGATGPELPWLVDCPQEKAVIIHVLAANPAYRGTGIARQLLLHVIDEARAADMASVRLSAALNNTPAVKLYESCGFIRIIESRQFWGGVMVDAVSLELPL